MANQQNLFERRKNRVRFSIRQRAKDRLRLSVYRSNSNIYAQVIDDKSGKTLVSASSLDKDLKKAVKSGANIQSAVEVGKLIAERAKKAKITEVVFDRGGYIYHGRVKALADAAREAGLNF